jgi:hypothetical protein
MLTKAKGVTLFAAGLMLVALGLRWRRGVRRR